MKHRLVISFIVLLALGTGCAWISPSSGAASEGIKVHGDWTVTITNPDGTLDAVHEFNNKLDAYGGRILGALLTGGYIVRADSSDVVKQTGYPDGWVLRFYGENFDNLHCEPHYSQSDKAISLIPKVFHDIQKQRVTLAAGCVVDKAYDGTFIKGVKTGIFYKRRDQYTQEVDVGVLLIDNFTKHDFDPEGYIEVELGQQVSFTINISFE